MTDHLPECNAGNIEDHRYGWAASVCKHCRTPMSEQETEAARDEHVCEVCEEDYQVCRYCEDHYHIDEMATHLLECDYAPAPPNPLVEAICSNPKCPGPAVRMVVTSHPLNPRKRGTEIPCPWCKDGLLIDAPLALVEGT